VNQDVQPVVIPSHVILVEILLLLPELEVSVNVPKMVSSKPILTTVESVT
jgi:hypothetical protein